jgi:dihydrofolate synthase/folylpolyglutamate synthase
VNAATLDEWLAYVERQHPEAIALGLERVARVRERMGVALACPVFTVGGTNGKGSACAFLEAMLRAAGYRTGLYSSPHLLRYNERVRVSGCEAGDATLCEAFAAVERARGGVPLTYFEFGTLAAAWLFARSRLDAVVLEVGLGGRLDAVNVFDPDCSVLTSIGIDHVAHLGHTREAIGREKAGIFRRGRAAIVADPAPPASVLDEAARCGAQLQLLGRDFGYALQAGQWRYWGPAGKRGALAYPALRGALQVRNAAAALAALDALRGTLPIGMQDVRRGLAEVRLPGRFQVVPGRPQIVLDVAHNPQAAEVLAANLGASGYAASVIGVCGMLRDKDMSGVLRAVAGQIARWHLAALPAPRGASAAELERALRSAGAQAGAALHDSPAAAFAAAQGEARDDDKIVVFGSFLTVAAAMAALEAGRRGHG